jgi:serine/threonine-protein kinase RsbW
MSNRFQITRAAELESLEIFRNFITECCAKYDIPGEVVLEIKLAVDEACANIIEHGYKGMDPGSIILAFWIEPDRILVQITDFGQIFEPVEGEKPDVEAALENEQIGGIGLYLIYQSMDNVDYQVSVEGNTLTFTKCYRASDKV